MNGVPASENTEVMQQGAKKSKKIRKIGLGAITIGIPFLWKLMTIYFLLSPGGGGALHGVFFHVTIALNFLCLICLGIMYAADLRDVILENRLIKKERTEEENVASYKTSAIRKQADSKWIALVASVVNTLSSIAIASILYTQETTMFNVYMIVFSVLTILFDILSLYSIYKFYTENSAELGDTYLGKKFERLKRKSSRLPHLKVGRSVYLAPAGQTVLGVASIATKFR